jgi:squalene-hopene/tetraprenyl-beta-curcumene cyclase
MRNTERGTRNPELIRTAEAGIRWLLDVQNRDGGIPTFCRGWGALPFDRSSADITAHAIRAWLAWRDAMPVAVKRRTNRALKRALKFLLFQQGKDGAFLPLWFGNQFAHDETNRSYGTARVLLALADWERAFGHVPHDWGTCLHLGMALEAVQWLVEAQHFDGGWSGDICREASTEETALAVHALAASFRDGLIEERGDQHGRALKAMERGVDWLIARVESGTWREPSPIGFYFAKLWYYERLYPMIFTVGALRATSEAFDAVQKSGGPKTAA